MRWRRRSMPRRSTCACRCSTGRRLAGPRQRSSCTRYSICTVPSNGSSNGSSNTCASIGFSARAGTRSRRKSGALCLPMYWSPSPRRSFNSMPRSTLSYRLFPSRSSRKPRLHVPCGPICHCRKWRNPLTLTNEFFKIQSDTAYLPPI
jgi:hypothetical protein